MKCRWPIVLLMIFTATRAIHAEDAKKGKLEQKVLDALRSTAAGTCREDLMAPMLLDACEQQLPQLQRQLAALGEMQGATYRGLETMPDGRQAEVYRVRFAGGSMTWMAGQAPDGKLNVLWSTMQVAPPAGGR